MHYIDETYILIFLLQLSLLLALSRGAGLLLRRFGQPAITGEILVGILLGPTVFRRFLPGLHDLVFPANIMQQNMLETVAWLGILFFLLDTGLETDLTAAWRQRRDALKLSLMDLLIPMAITFIPVMFLPQEYIGGGGSRLMFSLFIATIMTISALPVTARILQELNIYRSDAGILTMGALTINDVAGWIIFSVILGFATEGSLDFGGVIFIISATVLFAIISLTVGKRLTDFFLGMIEKCNLPQPGTSLTLICILGMIGGAVTLSIGVHALFGFFIAGIMAGESRHLSENTRQVISQVVRAVMVPLFFASIGLKIDFLAELDVPLVAFMLLLGVAGRFFGAWVGLGLTHQPRANRHIIAAAHTPGGEMQIVIGILALEYQVITSTVFVAIVVSAVLSSVALGPWMKLALKRGRRAETAMSFVPEQIVAPLVVANREDAIRRLSAAAADMSGLDGDTVAQAVLEREALMGTALVNGVAVPHARLPELATPRILFGRIPGGVEWNAPDGVLVNLVFLILTPAGEDTSQIHILSMLGKTMRCRENRKKLIDAETVDEISRVFAVLLKSEEACT